MIVLRMGFWIARLPPSPPPVAQLDRASLSLALPCLYSELEGPTLTDINLTGTVRWWDLLSEREINELDAHLELAPYQSVWLSNLDPG